FQVNSNLPVAAMQGLGLVSTTAAALYVTMMALYYAQIQASQGELESEMSHELRTPLNAVIGYSQILLEDAEAEGDKASVADLAKIHGAGQHLLKLVNEILDLSKIEAGRMELDLEEIDMFDMLQEIAEGA